MKLRTEPYHIQVARWPRVGRHILAQYDSDSVVVYQAYNAEIGHYAATHGHFGGTFSFERISWIKPNFLWMMYRSGCATKQNQEVVLAVHLKRSAFDRMLSLAVHSSYIAEVYASEEAWKTALAQSSVRLQWDPDHHPSGPKLERRAIQLGLRGPVLKHMQLSGLSVSTTSQISHANSIRMSRPSIMILCLHPKKLFIQLRI